MDIAPTMGRHSHSQKPHIAAVVVSENRRFCQCRLRRTLMISESFICGAKSNVAPAVTQSE
jgi:hypothetical protein